MKRTRLDTVRTGKILTANTNIRLTIPGTTMYVPFIVSRNAIRAASTAVIPVFVRLSPIPARDRNSVCVTPGQNTVTVTPVSWSSFWSEAENDDKNALHAAYTD